MGIIGISFPFQRGSTSFPKVSENNDVIAQNIQRILTTRRGERVMRPNAGSAVWDFVFENTGSVLNARIEHDVRQAIAEGEPRVTVLQVSITEEERRDGDKDVVVDIIYSVNLDIQQTTVTLGSSVSVGG
jgi:phage baseplate assembly protein W